MILPMSFSDYNSQLEQLTEHFLDSGGSVSLCVKSLRGLADDVEYAVNSDGSVVMSNNGSTAAVNEDVDVWAIPDMNTEELSMALADIANAGTAD